MPSGRVASVAEAGSARESIMATARISAKSFIDFFTVVPPFNFVVLNKVARALHDLIVINARSVCNQ